MFPLVSGPATLGSRRNIPSLVGQRDAVLLLHWLRQWHIRAPDIFCISIFCISVLVSLWNKILQRAWFSDMSIALRGCAARRRTKLSPASQHLAGPPQSCAGVSVCHESNCMFDAYICVVGKEIRNHLGLLYVFPFILFIPCCEVKCKHQQALANCSRISLLACLCLLRIFNKNAFEHVRCMGHQLFEGILMHSKAKTSKETQRGTLCSSQIFIPLICLLFFLYWYNILRAGMPTSNSDSMKTYFIYIVYEKWPWNHFAWCELVKPRQILPMWSKIRNTMQTLQNNDTFCYEMNNFVFQCDAFWFRFITVSVYTTQDQRSCPSSATFCPDHDPTLSKRPSNTSKLCRHVGWRLTYAWMTWMIEILYR